MHRKAKSLNVPNNLKICSVHTHTEWIKLWILYHRNFDSCFSIRIQNAPPVLCLYMQTFVFSEIINPPPPVHQRPLLNIPKLLHVLQRMNLLWMSPLYNKMLAALL